MRLPSLKLTLALLLVLEQMWQSKLADIILVRSNPLDVVAILDLARATYKKMVQNLAWATGYNLVAIPLAAGVLYSLRILLSLALGAVLMSLSTVIVAINRNFLESRDEQA